MDVSEVTCIENQNPVKFDQQAMRGLPLSQGMWSECLPAHSVLALSVFRGCQISLKESVEVVKLPCQV